MSIRFEVTRQAAVLIALTLVMFGVLTLMTMGNAEREQRCSDAGGTMIRSKCLDVKEINVDE